MEETEMHRSERLNMRISPTALELIRSAAAMQQQDVTSFVLGAAMERARAVALEHHVIRLSPRDWRQLEEALEADAVVIPELADAIRKVNGGRSRATASSSAH